MHKLIKAAEELRRAAITADLCSASGVLDTLTETDPLITITVDRGTELEWSFEAKWYNHEDETNVTLKMTFESDDNSPPF